MSIIESAKIELAAINFGAEDSAVMIEILQKFFSQWDSGGAVSCVAPVLMRLISGQPLSPITGADSEWMEVGPGVYQNIRCSSIFKQHDTEHGGRRGGMHPYDINNEAWDGRLPYDPTTRLPEEPVYEIGK